MVALGDHGVKGRDPVRDIRHLEIPRSPWEILDGSAMGFIRLVSIREGPSFHASCRGFLLWGDLTKDSPRAIIWVLILDR
jgi:hypothetical protein